MKIQVNGIFLVNCKTVGTLKSRDYHFFRGYSESVEVNHKMGYKVV